MEQLNQVLIEGLLTRSTSDVYHLTNDKCMSISVYIVNDKVKEKLRREIKKEARNVRIVGSLKHLDSMYYIDADYVEVKPNEVHKEQG